jgi:coenzyme F420-reducing hydrogenase beta subunit
MAVCPTNAIVIMGETPRLTGTCIKCGYCYYSCPLTTDETFKGFDEELDRVDERIFGRRREEPFGVYRRLYVVEPIVRENMTVEEAIITEVMKMGLEKGYFDVVGFGGYGESVTKYLLMPPRGRWEAVALIATKPGDFDKARLKPLTPGMLYNSVRGAYEELVSGFFYGSDPIRIALFGSPQHIRSVWRMRFSWSEHRKLSRTIVLSAAHFERPFYSYAELRKILSEDGINIDDVEDWNFDDDGITFIVGGKTIKYTFDKLSPAIYKGFNTLRDPTGEYADFSVGKLRGIDGVVIIGRTEEGVKMIDEAIEDGRLRVVEFDLDSILLVLRGLYGD